MTAEQIRRKRRRLRLTQEGLAERLGVSVGAVRHWEQGLRPISRPTALLLQQLAEAAKTPAFSS